MERRKGGRRLLKCVYTYAAQSNCKLQEPRAAWLSVWERRRRWYTTRTNFNISIFRLGTGYGGGGGLLSLLLLPDDGGPLHLHLNSRRGGGGTHGQGEGFWWCPCGGGFAGVMEDFPGLAKPFLRIAPFFPKKGR